MTRPSSAASWQCSGEFRGLGCSVAFGHLRRGLDRRIASPGGRAPWNPNAPGIAPLPADAHGRHSAEVADAAWRPLATFAIGPQPQPGGTEPPGTPRTRY